jgi:hypothetical protein
MCHRALVLAAVLGSPLLGCATAPGNEILSVSLKYPDGHPGFVSARLLVSASPLDLESLPTSTANELRVAFATSGRFADVVPNACYMLIDEAGRVSAGFASLTYTGDRIAGTLIEWIDAGYSIELNVDDADGVTGKAIFAGSTSSGTLVIGAATRMPNLDACIEMVGKAGT